MSVRINVEKCIGCGKCKNICSMGAIKIENKKAVVDYTCIQCGRCIHVCPREAISLNASLQNEIEVKENETDLVVKNICCDKAQKNSGIKSCGHRRRHMMKKVNHCRCR